MDESFLESAILKANTEGSIENDEWDDHDTQSYIEAKILEVHNMSLRSAVSFNKKNGLTGNLRNAEVNSTVSSLEQRSSSFWKEVTGVDLGSTVFLSLLNSWASSVKSYLSNGRDPDLFHFSLRDEYLIEPFAMPAGYSLVHLPVDPKDIQLNVDKSWLQLSKKPDLREYSRVKGEKRIFVAKVLMLTFDKGNTVEKDINVKKCLLDTGMANPLLDGERAAYYLGFAKLILEDEKDGKSLYTLRIPTTLGRAINSVKSEASREKECVDVLNQHLPGMIYHIISRMSPYRPTTTSLLLHDSSPRLVK
jgi:hypothetical protein